MKKNEKRLCWNCDGDVRLHLDSCPYCGVNLSQPQEKKEPPYKGQTLGDPFQQAPSSAAVPKPPFRVTDDEWEGALKEEGTAEPQNARGDTIALLLLLPGIVFCLFALLLLFFSDEGMLTLRWNQNLAYFYLLGAVPLIYLGWRAIGK